MMGWLRRAGGPIPLILGYLRDCSRTPPPCDAHPLDHIFPNEMLYDPTLLVEGCHMTQAEIVQIATR
jgi:hypothetical protein